MKLYLNKVYYLLLSAVLKVFFRLLYHEMAWSYDCVAAIVSAGLWQDWVAEIIPYIRGKMILELGHGTGNLQSFLYRIGDRPYGLDRSRQMGNIAFRKISGFLEKNKKSIDGIGYAQYPLLVRANTQNIPFPHSVFDCLVATFPTRYIFDPDTLSEVYRVLSPGGRLLIVFTGWITGKKLHERLAGLLFRITGQSETWQPAWSSPFLQMGFSIETQWIELPSSRVFILIAEKPIRETLVEIKFS